jgi:hypothetical protein
MAALRGLYSSSHPDSRKTSSAALMGSYYSQGTKSSCFRDLSNDDLAKLANVLAHQPAPNDAISKSQKQAYKELTQNHIKALPTHLHAEKRYSSHPSCSMHSRLSPVVMRSILNWVQQEVNVNIPALLYALAKADCLSESIRARFHTLRDISGLWIRPEAYQKFFKRSVIPRWTEQEDHCAACMLARIGGEHDILTALKAGMIANTASKGISRSRRHRYIDALIDKSFDEKSASKIFAEAGAMGMQIKEAAHSLVRTLREEGKDPKGTSPRSRSSKPGKPQHRRNENAPEKSLTTRGRVGSVAPFREQAKKHLFDQYNSLDELIKGYRQRVYIPPVSRASGQTDLSDYPLTAARSSFASSSDPGLRISYEGFIDSAPAKRKSRDDFDLEEYYAPMGQSSRQRAVSYGKDLDVDEFLNELDELSPVVKKNGV